MLKFFVIFTHAYGGGGRSAELEGGFSAPLEKKSKFSHQRVMDFHEMPILTLLHL